MCRRVTWRVGVRIAGRCPKRKLISPRLSTAAVGGGMTGGLLGETGLQSRISSWAQFAAGFVEDLLGGILRTQSMAEYTGLSSGGFYAGFGGPGSANYAVDIMYWLCG